MTNSGRSAYPWSHDHAAATGEVVTLYSHGLTKREALAMSLFSIGAAQVTMPMGEDEVHAAAFRCFRIADIFFAAGDATIPQQQTMSEDRNNV